MTYKFVCQIWSIDWVYYSSECQADIHLQCEKDEGSKHRDPVGWCCGRLSVTVASSSPDGSFYGGIAVNHNSRQLRVIHLEPLQGISLETAGIAEGHDQIQTRLAAVEITAVIHGTPNLLRCSCVTRCWRRNATGIAVPKTFILSTTSEGSNCWGWVVDQEAHAHLVRCCCAVNCCLSSVDRVKDTLHGDLVSRLQFSHGSLPGKRKQ